MTTIPDPNGDRNCYQRWAHREIESLEVDGFLVCPECYTPNPPVEETPAPEQ